MHLQAGDRILFQGDSITDCGRMGASAPWGDGYVAMLAGRMRVERPEQRLEVLNRGVSGDRTVELAARWRPDCLDLKPQALSIMIGVNDCWRKLAEWAGQTWVQPDAYRANLERLCDQALAGGVRTLVLVSPTSIAPANDDPMNRLLGEYADAAKAIAQARRALWVDARAPLMAARQQQPEVPWTPDGCHPSIAGHAVIAAAWWKAVIG